MDTIVTIAVVALVLGLGYYIYQRRSARGTGKRATGDVRRPR